MKHSLNIWQIIKLCVSLIKKTAQYKQYLYAICIFQCFNARQCVAMIGITDLRIAIWSYRISGKMKERGEPVMQFHAKEEVRSVLL